MIGVCNAQVWRSVQNTPLGTTIAILILGDRLLHIIGNLPRCHTQLFLVVLVAHPSLVSVRTGWDGMELSLSGGFELLLVSGWFGVTVRFFTAVIPKVDALIG